MGGQSTGGTDSVGVASRAGTVVREQIAAMIEAAQSTGAEIEREAGSSADETRREANQAAGGVVERFVGLERELALLLRGVSREADGLRAKLERARMVSGYSQAALAAPSHQGLEAEHPELPRPPAEHPELPRPPAELQAAPLSEASPDPPQPAASEEAPVEVPEESSGDPARDTREFRNIDLANLAALSDLELAELYGVATAALFDPIDLSEIDEAHWNAVVVATVEQATKRPEFGSSKAGETDPGRREKKRRSKIMRPLIEARAKASSSSGSADR